MPVRAKHDLGLSLYKMKLSTSVLFFLISLSVQAQSIQKIRVSGIVRSPAPIHAADCFLKNNEHLGGLTDTLGYFQFSVPRTLLYDTLVISAMGFERKEVPLSSLDVGPDTAYFYLDQQSILLQEVLIESNGLDLKKMMLKAVANMPNNYPNKRHQLKGLYRKVSTNGTEYTHLEEAAITLEDNSYKMPPQLIKIKTEHFRESNDWGVIDSLYVTMRDKMGSQISRQLNTSRNPLYRIYERNPLRNFNKDNTYFNFKSMRKVIDDHYRFELMDISVVDGDTIYQIAFAESVTPPPPKRASGRTYLRINVTDLAIVEAQLTKGFENKALMSQQQIKFEKKHGRYYPKYIRDINARSINRKYEDDEFDIHTFWFDDVKVKDLERIKHGEVNDPGDPQSHKRQPLSSGFWDSTQLIKKYPLEPGVKMGLEKRQPLEEQFRQKGQN